MYDDRKGALLANIAQGWFTCTVRVQSSKPSIRKSMLPLPSANTSQNTCMLLALFCCVQGNIINVAMDVQANTTNDRDDARFNYFMEMFLQ